MNVNHFLVWPASPAPRPGWARVCLFRSPGGKRGASAAFPSRHTISGKIEYKKTPSAKSALRDNNGVAASGSSKGNRTPDFALRGRRLNRLTMEPDWLGN